MENGLLIGGESACNYVPQEKVILNMGDMRQEKVILMIRKLLQFLIKEKNQIRV